MDLKQYFKKIKDTEESIQDEYPLVVSLETTDGGKAGTVVEVSRREAAKSIVENRAVLANEVQKRMYFEREAARRKSAEKAEMSRRLQIAIISNEEFRDLNSASAEEGEPTGSR